MRETLTYVAIIVIVISPIPYVMDILRNRTHPNIVTWITWSLINVINTAAAFAAGAWQTGLYLAAGTVATVTIALLGLRHGVRKYTTFDIGCQVAALAGIPVWLLTHQPALAVAVELAVDLAGGLPTLRHALRAPQEETLRTFALSALGGLLLLVSLNEYSFVAVAVPAYILCFDTLLCLSIVVRRQGLSRHRS